MASEDKTNSMIGGKYIIRNKLGEGGMGVVYEGEHAGMGRRVAIKMLHGFLLSNEDVVKRFYREAHAAAAIAHRNIIDVLDVGVTESGEPYLVMEFLEGKGLAALLETRPRLELAVACAIMEPCLVGLQAAHEKGIVHRDLKPDNIFITLPPGLSPEIKLIDFGISKFQDTGQTKLTVQGTTMGTPAYMSPEQARGAADVNHLSDIYAMGVILYEMLAGDMPYAGENYNELLFSILTQEPRPPQEVFADFPMQAWPLISRAIARDPAQRFENAAHMLVALRNLVPAQERQAALLSLADWIVHKAPAETIESAEAAERPDTSFAAKLLSDAAQTTLRRREEKIAPTPPATTRILSATAVADIPSPQVAGRSSISPGDFRKPIIVTAVIAAVALLLLVIGPCSRTTESDPSAEDTIAAPVPDLLEPPPPADMKKSEPATVSPEVRRADSEAAERDAETSGVSGDAQTSPSTGRSAGTNKKTEPKKSKKPFRSLRNDLRDAFGKNR